VFGVDGDSLKVGSVLKGAKGGFSCYEQKVEGSSSGPQSHAKGSEGRMTEKGDKND